MGETSSGERGRARESGPDQRENSEPTDIAWPGADAEDWPGTDTDDQDAPAVATPLRDETHVADGEPRVTPPGEPAWPDEEPGPTTELPTPPAEATRVMRPVARTERPAEDTAPGIPAVDPAPSGEDTHPGMAPADRTQPTARPRSFEGAETTRLTRPENPAERTMLVRPVATDRPAGDEESRPAPADAQAEETRFVPADAQRSNEGTRPGHADAHRSAEGPRFGQGDSQRSAEETRFVPSDAQQPAEGARFGQADGQRSGEGRFGQGDAQRSAEETRFVPSDGQPSAERRFGQVEAQRLGEGARFGQGDGQRSAEETRFVSAELPRRGDGPGAQARQGGRSAGEAGPHGRRPVGASGAHPAEETRFIRGEQRRPEEAAPFAEETGAADRSGGKGHVDPPVDDGPGEPQPDGGRPRRRRTGLIVAVAAAVVVAVAAGVVFAVPGIAERLGLVDGDEVAIAPPPAAVRFEPVLAGPREGVTPPSAEGVASALAGPANDPDLGTLTGVVIDPVTGQTLFSRDPDTALVPASTTKLLSTAAVLLTLPHTERLVTKVVAGDEPGTVIIVGGGDPTLSSLPEGKDSVFPGAAHLDELVAQVKATGPVDTVLVDLSRYTGDGLARGWLPADVPAGHITPIVPAMMDAARQDPTDAVSPRSNNPGRALAEEFARRIGATVPSEAQTTAKPDARVLGEVESAPIAELVHTAVQRSDNVLAETLIRELAIATGQEPSFTGATTAVVNVLRENGFAVDGLVLRDGSGMSTENRVTSALLGEVLKAAAAPDGADPRTAKLRPLLSGLPVAGGNGTLDKRYLDGPAAAGKGWVRAKTGTLSAVNSLAGVVLDSDGRLLVFALMSNGTNPLDARPALDAVAAALHKCGCE
ncbi:D-alanyl-D-alanine carboxypeptidase/D-alanyl-D-alanine endopeptidase [Actinokineospora fastidiosa]|uniref:D-alanyl-D-alanine carboxypeptidase n=1 Tax=Actinokineospora fastidiosa TaxID=1816 RepID=A0A918G3C4_9PSEU|nr:D-alanyl-D-alanine carboxypeptidase/D-alanyl-D-alanine-endopeptidase [Actinokineospora fastidiosa]GGS16860.1 D-alanyl-D-alanine carboxypeptidase [Actinokineospora fastidiosa]